LGGGMLNKSSGFLSLYLIPFSLFLFDWKKSGRMHRLIRWAGLMAAAAVLSQIVYSVLRLSPFFHMISRKDTVFLFSFREWLDQPFRFLAGNLRGMSDWLRSYMSLPVFIAVCIPLFTRWPRMRERMMLYAWWAVPFVGLANFGKVLYPRFILFMTIPLLIIAADSVLRMFAAVKRPLAIVCLAAVVLLPSLMLSSVIVTDPEAARIPVSDRGQFIDDWPAGGGVSEVVTYLTEQARHGKIAVYTEGTFGLMPYAIEMYLVDNPNVIIKGIWPLTEEIPPEISDMAVTRPTYVILNETQVAPKNWPLMLIGEYQKGERVDRKLRFYRVVTPLAAR